VALRDDVDSRLMPPRAESALSASARLRRLERRLPELSVPVLLRLRDAIEAALAADRVTVSQADTVLLAADEA
jgi:hypothetical protein